MNNSLSAFERLPEPIQRWIFRQNPPWQLRPFQVDAINALLDRNDDLIVSAGTASGKTEAVFLPLCARILGKASEDLRVLCISPLKALINDQFERIDRLCETLDIPVHRWHGDVSRTAKQRVLRRPSGILIITPESLEAQFVLHGSSLGSVYAGLQYVVIDELHAFIGTERGRHLQSLIHRLEILLQRRLTRIGLSATLGMPRLAADFLRPGEADNVHCIVAPQSQELQLRVEGFLSTPPSLSSNEDHDSSPKQAIAHRLLNVHRTGHHLIFANTRHDVEAFTDLLSRLSEKYHLLTRFLPHHGSLAREFREDAESLIKSNNVPVSLVCTSTLELGIDIGLVKSVAQVGSPPSVSSLKQRLGRSGRRGEPSEVRAYIQEEELGPNSPWPDRIRCEMVQTIAMIQLLLDGWCEPPTQGAMHLSTLVHQTLSLIAQHGGVMALEAWRILCQSGPFQGVTSGTFAELLRSMHQADLLTQTHDGLLVLGLKGEQIVSHFSFFTAFQTPEEFRLTSRGRTLGTIPVSSPLSEGMFLIFSGKRWRILMIDSLRKHIVLEPAPGGKAPIFSGLGAPVHDRVRTEMLKWYLSDQVPAYLDPRARELLDEGRSNFKALGLSTNTILDTEEGVAWFPWLGDRVLSTLQYWLRHKGLPAERDRVALFVKGISSRELTNQIQMMHHEGMPHLRELAALVNNKHIEKFHPFLDEQMLCDDYASAFFDGEGALLALEACLIA